MGKMTIPMLIYYNHSQLSLIIIISCFQTTSFLFFFVLSSLRTAKASRQPEASSSDSSDTDGESLYGPESKRGIEPSQGSTAALRATMNRPCEAPIRQGLDRELQDFISMRDQTDKATEVRERV